VEEMAARKHLGNVETILSDCQTGIPDHSLDVALLYDILHDLGDPQAILAELHRVLKPDGILSVSDHHMKEKPIVAKVTEGGLFAFERRGPRTYRFQPRSAP